MAEFKFSGTVKQFNLGGDIRTVIDPRTMPDRVRDAVCRQHNYRLPSIIGPNHDVAYYDMRRQGWRDMRYATEETSCDNVELVYSTISGTIELPHF